MTSIFKDNGKHELISLNPISIEDRISNLENRFNTQFVQILSAIKTINTPNSSDSIHPINSSVNSAIN